jgi:hypothetical protein
MLVAKSAMRAETVGSGEDINQTLLRGEIPLPLSNARTGLPFASA